METHSTHWAGWLLILCLAGSLFPIQAQTAANDSAGYVSISGTVRDQASRKRMEYVNISVPGSNIGTITNGEGTFTLKIPRTMRARTLEASHIGYLNAEVAIGTRDTAGLIIRLIPNENTLEEIIIRPDDARQLVLKAIEKIPINYSRKSNLLTGFYRETARKGRRYITVSEAIVDVYKSDYAYRQVEQDRVQVCKGRKILSQKPSDTLAVKLLGGPNLALYVDVVKHAELLLTPDELGCYNFRMEESIRLDDRPNYVISFSPRLLLPYALYYGKLYIDKEKLAFTRAEFQLDMEDRGKATAAILKKKPFGLRFRPLEVSFLVNYQENGGITYLSYMRNEVRFKCDWKRKLFSTTYAIVSEFVTTDRKEQKSNIPYRDAFKNSQSLSDKVSNFSDENFWGAYNIIEPTESLENAVRKLKKQQPEVSEDP